jgi:hypothetical protein
MIAIFSNIKRDSGRLYVDFSLGDFTREQVFLGMPGFGHDENGLVEEYLKQFDYVGAIDVVIHGMLY